MLTVKLLLLTLLSSGTYAADLSTWTYADESGKNAELTLYDKQNVSGEEMLTWKTADGSIQMAKPTSASEVNVETPFFVESSSGEILMDVNLGISLGSSFAQSKAMLKDASFRKAFQYLPESCGDNNTAFLVVMNNLESTMFGYCLTPKN